MHGMKGEAAPNFGVKRTEKQKQHHSEGAKKRWTINGDKLREMMKTPEYRRANSKSQKHSNEEHPEFVQKRSKSVNAFWSSDSTLTKQRRKEASDRAVDLLSQGKIGPNAPFKTCYMKNTFTGKEEYMHSGWETQFLSECISMGLPVTKDHHLRIPYVGLDGNDHLYVPDFITLDPDNKVIFEIKGQRDETDDLKEIAARRWCEDNGYRFVVVGNQMSSE